MREAIIKFWPESAGNPPAMEQQVRKVLYEDLMMLTKYRKPENVLRFFLFLLAHPGIEINTAKVSQETGIERRVIDENLPRSLRDALLTKGLPARDVRDIGLKGHPDEEVLAAANEAEMMAKSLTFFAESSNAP